MYARYINEERLTRPVDLTPRRSPLPTALYSSPHVACHSRESGNPPTPPPSLANCLAGVRSTTLPGILHLLDAERQKRRRNARQMQAELRMYPRYVNEERLTHPVLSPILIPCPDRGGM